MKYMNRIAKSPFLKNAGPADFPFAMLEAQIPATLIELPDPYSEGDNAIKTIDARKIRVGKVFENPQTKCLFTYDFGGTGGLEELIAAFKNGSGEKYRELKEWFGEKQFDFSTFDIKESNSCLKSDMKMYKSNCEDKQW
jgi:hypothetical protein